MSKCRSSARALVAALLAVARERPGAWRRMMRAATQARKRSRNYGIGAAAAAEQIAGWDIDVRPDGRALPPGQGLGQGGRGALHGRAAPPAMASSARAPAAGRRSRKARARSHPTIRSRPSARTFAHLSSVFDYVRRAMPFGDAQSLTNDELYAVVAYVLYLNDIVDDKFVLSKETWAQVKMPNAGGFYDDDRETTEKAFWNAAALHDGLPAAGRRSPAARA